jgi:hypothetical protein
MNNIVIGYIAEKGFQYNYFTNRLGPATSGLITFLYERYNPNQILFLVTSFFSFY